MILYLPEPSLVKVVIICSYKILEMITKDRHVIKLGSFPSTSHNLATKYYCEVENTAYEMYVSDRWPEDLLHIEDIILPTDERGDNEDEDYRQIPKHYVYAQRPI